MNAPRQVVALRWAKGRVELPDGQYLIGRSAACDVVIDDSRVSRRHAQLEVEGSDVHLVDLDSRNGVFVNDRPVRRVQALADGDLMLIGGAELTLELAPTGPAPVRRPPRIYVVLAGEKEDVTVRGASAPSPEPQAATPVTKTFDDLELIGRVAERALLAGHVRQAEAMIEGHLRRVLDDVLRQRPVSGLTGDRAVEIGLRLAEATHRGSWFDYVVDLLRARRIACSDRLLDRLRSVREQVDRVDPQRIKRYVDTLRAGEPTMDELRAAQRLHLLLPTG